MQMFKELWASDMAGAEWCQVRANERRGEYGQVVKALWEQY